MEDTFTILTLQRNRIQPITLTYFLAALPIAYIVYLIYIKCKAFQRLYYLASKIDGPKSYPLIGNLLTVYERKNGSAFKSKITRTIERRCQEQQKKLGARDPKDDIMKLWIFLKFFVIVKDPVHAQDILKNSAIPKNKYYKLVFEETALGVGILSQINHNVWRHQRKLLTPTFHFKILHTYFHYFYEEAVTLCNKIMADSKTNEFVELDMKLKMAGFEMIIRNVLGVQVNAQDNPEHPFIMNIIKTCQLTQRRLYQPWLLSTTIFKLLGYYKEQKTATIELQNYLRKVIKMKRDEMEKLDNNNDGEGTFETIKKEKYSNRIETFKETMANDKEDNENFIFETKTKSFLDLLLEMGDEHQDRLTDEEIMPELTTIFFAALDTTSTTNLVTLLLLAMHPDVLKKTQEEIDSVFGGPKNDDGHQPTAAELTKLDYMECVIKESGRLYPAAPVVFREVVEEVQCGDYTLPVGTSVMVMIAAVHRNKNYHPDPKKFRPERFFPEEMNKRHPYSYIPFSAGPRNCLGQKYAMLQMKIVISTILRRFHLVPSPHFQCVNDIDKQCTMDITLRISNGAVKFIPRK